MADYEDDTDVLEPEAPAEAWRPYDDSVDEPKPLPRQPVPEPEFPRVAQADVQTGVQSDANRVQTPVQTAQPAQAAVAPPADTEAWRPHDDPDEGWRPYTEPDESGAQAMAREMGYGAVPAVAGAITGGLASGAVGSSLGPIGTIGAGIAGGLVGGFGAAAVQDEALKALGRDDNAVRAANRQAYPWWTAAGAGLSMAAGAGAGLKNAAMSLGGRLFGAGVGGAVETGVQAYHGTPVKEAVPQVIGSTVGGFVFAAPRAPARAAERVGTSIRHAINPPPPPPPPPPRVGVDQPGVKTRDWTGPPAEVGPHVPPEQGQLPFGQGAAARPPEAPQVRFTPKDAVRKEELALKAKFRGSNLTREEQAEYAALEQKEAAAARPQRPQIGGGEAQPELPFPPPPPPPRTGYSQQPELPLEPPPVINAEGQYGFTINAPHPGNQYQHTPPPMPAGAGTSREAAPPPRLKEPDPAPHSAVRRGLFSETPPDAAAGIHVLQPGQVDSTVRHGLAARNVEPRQPPQRYSFEPRRPPPQPAPPPDTSPLPRNQSLAIRPAEGTQGTTEPSVPPGHTRMYQGANQPEKQFSPDRSVAARYGAVQFVDVDNKLGRPFFTPMQMGSPEYVSRNLIYRQRLRPVQEMRTGTGQPPEPPTGGSSPPPPPPTPPSSGGPRMSDPNLDAQISQALGPQQPAAPAAQAPPAPRTAILKTTAGERRVRLSNRPVKMGRDGNPYQPILVRGQVHYVPAGQLTPIEPKAAPAPPPVPAKAAAPAAEAAKPPPAPAAKPATTADAPPPQWWLEQRQAAIDDAKRLGLTAHIGRLAKEGWTAQQISEKIGGKLDAAEVRHVRDSLGIAGGEQGSITMKMPAPEAPPLAPKPKETPSLAGMAKPKDESKFTPAEQEELNHSKKIENAIDRIEEAGEAGDRTALAKAAADAREVLKTTPDHIKQSDPEYWGQFDGADGVIARMEAPGYKFTPAVVDATPIPTAGRPEHRARMAGKFDPDIDASSYVTHLYELSYIKPKGGDQLKAWEQEVLAVKKNQKLKAESEKAAPSEGPPTLAGLTPPKAAPPAAAAATRKSLMAEHKKLAAKANKTSADFDRLNAIQETLGWNKTRLTDEAATKPGALEKYETDYLEKNLEYAKNPMFGMSPKLIPAIEAELAARKSAPAAEDSATSLGSLQSKPKETLLTKTSGSRPAVDFIGPLKDDITASHYAHRMAEMRSHKPRPVNKMWRNPDAADPKQVAAHEAKIKVWEKEYRAVSKNQKEALARDNAAFAERQKTTPKSEPLRRDVTERGPGGRPTKTAPLKIGAEEKILEKGFARTVSGMQEASRLHGARQTAERPSRPDNMNVPAHRRSTEYGLAVRDQQYGSIKGKAGNYDYWHAIAKEEGHLLGGKGRPNAFTAARAHSRDGKTTVVLGHDGRRTIYRDGERIHRDRVYDPIPSYLIESEPARRSTIEAAARKHGGLEPATEALVKRIQQRVDDIKAGRAAPGSGQVQRLAIRRSDVDKSRAKVAGAAKVAPQIKTMNGVVFTGATVHEAALKAINGGFRPNQLYTMTGTPYTPPPAAPTAAPAGPPQVAAAAAPSAGAAGPPAGGGRPPGGPPPPAPASLTPASPSSWSLPPGRLNDAWQATAGKVLDFGHSIQMMVSPMTRGTQESMSLLKDFSSSLRRNQWDWSHVDYKIERAFTPERRKAMWDAADAESVAQQEGKTTRYGLSSLAPEERAAVQALQASAKAAWDKAKALDMVQGEGLPAYTPRMLINLVGGMKRDSKTGGPQGLDPMALNLRVTTPQMKHRKHLTAAETELAGKQKFGVDTELVRDIRTLPLAIAKLEDAIAGRQLMNTVRDIGKRTGQDTVVEGGRPVGTEKWFTIDHPAFKVWRVRKSDGDKTFTQVPLYVRGDFEGPMRSVFTVGSGMPYRAMMALKSKTMSVIMNSPLIHNAVEWGRAMPAMPGKVLTFRVYFEGARAKKDPALMREAITNGLVPIGKRAFNQDIHSIMEAPNLTPGRSWTAQVAGFLPGLFDPKAGAATRHAIDRAGDFWHNTMLWDRVGDLQAGLYVNLKNDLTAKGVDNLTASRAAAHWANRYAGALPQEAMSSAAQKFANIALFSRSFTLGNVGAMKDMFNGLPRDVQAQIARDLGSLNPEGAKYIRSLAQRKALAIIGLDVALMYIGNSLLQSGINVLRGDKTLDKEMSDYTERFSGMLQEVKEHPASLMQPMHLIESVSATAENEPGKQDRLHIGYTADGQAIYARNPVGKIGEEFTGWLSSPLDMVKRKLGTVVRPVWQIMANDKGFGRKVYDPHPHTTLDQVKNFARIVEHIVMAQTPEIQLRGGRDLITGEGDRKLNTLQTFGPITGVTFSRGAPGGPAQGEIYRARERHQFEVNQAMPDIRRMINRGEVDKAIGQMIDLGMPPGLIRYHIRTTLAPETRLTPRSMRDFQRYATPAERERFRRALEKREGIQ